MAVYSCKITVLTGDLWPYAGYGFHLTRSQLVMCWAGSQSLRLPSQARSNPSQARPWWGLAMGLCLASYIRSPSPGFDILQSGMQIHDWKGKILFCFKRSIQFNEGKIGVTCTSSTASVDPISISFDLMESYSLARTPTAINMNMNNRIPWANPQNMISAEIVVQQTASLKPRTCGWWLCWPHVSHSWSYTKNMFWCIVLVAEIKALQACNLLYPSKAGYGIRPWVSQFPQTDVWPVWCQIEEDSARVPMQFQLNQYCQIKIRVVWSGK